MEQQVVLQQQQTLGVNKMCLFLAQQTSFLEQRVDHNCLCDASVFRDAPEAVEKLTFHSSARAMNELSTAGTGGEQHKSWMRKWPKQHRARY